MYFYNHYDYNNVGKKFCRSSGAIMIMKITTITIIITIIRLFIAMFAGNSVEQVVPGPDFTAGVKNVTVPEGRLVFNINKISKIL